MMQLMELSSRPDRRLRTLCWAAGGLLLILAIAQFDEHRRYSKAAEKPLAEMVKIMAEQQAYFDLITQYLQEAHRIARLNEQSRLASKQNPVQLPMPPRPPYVRPVMPIVPRAEDYDIVSRMRRGICFGAFAVCIGLPILWILSSPSFLRQNRKLLAETMLIFAMFGTIGMMLGWGYWRNWCVFAPSDNAAGWGLVLIPLSLAAIVIARKPAVSG